MARVRSMRRELMPLARVQMRMALTACVPVVLSCLLVSAATTYFFLTSLRSRGALSSGFAREMIPVAAFIAAINLLVLVPTFMFIAIWVSHKIIGPMRRMAREFEEIGRGKLHGRFQLRPGDEMVFLAESLNGMREALRERIAGCLRRQQEIESLVRDVLGEKPHDLGAALRSAVAQAGEALKGFQMAPLSAPPSPEDEDAPRK